MNTKTKKWLIIGIGAAALIGGGIYLYNIYGRKKKEDESPSVDALPTTQAPPPVVVLPPVPTVNSTIKDVVEKPKIIMPVKASKNANIYSITYIGKESRVGRLSRIVKTQNENIGYFVRYVSIGGQDYLVFGDKGNGNKPSLILKSQTNYYNK